MDDIDKKIIGTMKEDARTPFLRIAKELKVTEGTIRKRVGKLVADGTIRRFTIDLKSGATALVEVTTSSEVPTKKIVDTIMAKKGIEKIYEVAGRYTLLVMMKADSLLEINDLVESIRAVRGVIQTETRPVLKED